MRGRRVHDVDPNRQRELTTKRAAINFLRFIEAGPNRAAEIAVVAREECVREIVSGASFSCHRKFFEAKLRARSFAGTRFERVHQARVHFVSSFWFNYRLSGAIALRVPNNCPVLFFDPIEDVG